MGVPQAMAGVLDDVDRACALVAAASPTGWKGSASLGFDQHRIATLTSLAALRGTVASAAAAGARMDSERAQLPSPFRAAP